jgi:hypothetical protein
VKDYYAFEVRPAASASAGSRLYTAEFPNLSIPPMTAVRTGTERLKRTQPERLKRTHLVLQGSRSGQGRQLGFHSDFRPLLAFIDSRKR